MDASTLKLLSPALFVAVWLVSATRTRSPYLAAAMLFFTSIAAFSQNFEFIYRDLHRGIQLLLVAAALPLLLDRRRLIRVKGVAAGFAGLLGLIAVSIAANRLDTDAAEQTANTCLATGVCLFLYLAIGTRRRLDQVLDHVAALAVVAALLGLFESAAGISDRIETSFANPNYFAFFVGIGVCRLVTRGGWPAWLGAAVAIVAIVLSGSRAALAFPILAIPWAAYRARGPIALAAAAAVGFAVIAAMFASGATRLSNAEDLAASDAERVIFTGIAVSMAADHPLTGIGWGRYIAEFGRYAGGAERVYLTDSVIDVSFQERRVAHSDLFRIVAELGWIAAAAAVLALGRGAWIIVFDRRQALPPFVMPVWVGAIAFSLSHNNMNSALFWFVFFLPFWIRTLRDAKPVAPLPWSPDLVADQ